MAGKRAQRCEKDANRRDGYFFCNFIFCFLVIQAMQFNAGLGRVWFYGMIALPDYGTMIVRLVKGQLI
jgi:hypothetical protein